MKYKQLTLDLYVPPDCKKIAPWVIWALARKFWPPKSTIKAEQLRLWEDECQ